MTLSEVITVAINRLKPDDIDATAHLLASPANATRLLAAVEDRSAGGDMIEIENRAD